MTETIWDTLSKKWLYSYNPESERFSHRNSRFQSIEAPTGRTKCSALLDASPKQKVCLNMLVSSYVICEKVMGFSGSANGDHQRWTVSKRSHLEGPYFAFHWSPYYMNRPVQSIKTKAKERHHRLYSNGSSVLFWKWPFYSMWRCDAK